MSAERLPGADSPPPVDPGPAGPAPWTPDIVVGPELALELIRAQFPALGATEVRPLGAGWDNTAYLAGDVVFRFPRRRSTVALLEREMRVLPRLAPALPLPVPLPELVGVPAPGYPWPFAGYRRLPGTTASEAPLTDAQLMDAAGVLGAFLAALHAVPVGDLPLPGDEIGRLNIAARLPSARARLAALATAGLVDDPATWLRLLERPAPLVATTGVVVHGDLYARHLLVEDDGRLCGVIDWGDVHVGDPAVDLMVLWGFLPAAVRPAFRRAYGNIEERALALARQRATFHAIAVAHYAAEAGDASLLAAGLAALRHVLEE